LAVAGLRLGARQLLELGGRDEPHLHGDPADQGNGTPLAHRRPLSAGGALRLSLGPGPLRGAVRREQDLDPGTLARRRLDAAVAAASPPDLIRGGRAAPPPPPPP